MSFLDKLADRVEAYQKELWQNRYPYLTLEGGKWEVKKNGFGCHPLKAQAAITMDKNPPPLPGEQTKPASSLTANAKTAALTKEAEALQQKRAAEDAKKKIAQEKQEDCPQPPPFDMLDLPEGMKAMGFKYAAHCANKWFNGKAHVIEEEQKGNPAVIQPAEFVDKDTFNLDWILKFGDVRARYKHLLAIKPDDVENVYNNNARQELVKLLRQFMSQHNYFYSGTLDTLADCGKDPQVLHQRFQFQHVRVTNFDVLGGYTTAMNDLAASLANFNFYAAIATAEISTQQYMRYGEKWWSCTKTTAEITHIYVYAKDHYSFNDNMNISQYLGHWNRQGVIIALDAAAADIFKIPERGNQPRQYLPALPVHLDKPVDIKSSLRKADVFYPVRNRDFRRWREIKGRGSDLLIFSNLQKVRLSKPIVIDLNEVCKEYKK
jgi:hypothetical protein